MKGEKVFDLAIDTIQVCLALVLLWAVWNFYGTRVWWLIVVFALFELILVGFMIRWRCSKDWEIRG